ncbi:MAG: hypothetical protein ACREKB_11810, partial [Candidatus Rokuibacteriota bacterium]
MSYLIVPKDVSASTAAVWVGAVNERPGGSRISLESPAGSAPLDPNWSRWQSQDGSRTLDHRRVLVTGLQPRRTYSLALQVDGQTRAAGSVTTLPAQLPAVGDRPFTVLLGSCFCMAKDGAGLVGRAWFQLAGAARPEVKILCGDQVYLDSPWHHFLFNTHNRRELEEQFFTTYVQTWTQRGDAAGFQRVLEDGANYFSSDDHEYWNNAPKAGVYVRDTWSAGGRRQWLEAARDLFRRFQTESPVAAFAAPPLSFRVAETRLNRTSDRARFMNAADLSALGQWIDGLAGPGVLV